MDHSNLTGSLERRTELLIHSSNLLTLDDLAKKNIYSPDEDLLNHENSSRLDKKLGMKAIRFSWIKSHSSKAYTKIFGHCPMTPHCSHYAYMAISEHGLLKGALYAFNRIESCNPMNWSKLPVVDGRYHDPVPKHK